MNDKKLPVGLYLVSTPIGAARDITLRALDILANADVLAAEDTRNTRRLLDIHGIALGSRRIIPYHDHNGSKQRPKLIDAIQNGQTVAYVSDAGTPLIADPGYGLAKEAGKQGLDVFAAPGASALLAALVVSGMPTDRFMFAGFAPNKQKAKQSFLQEFAELQSTLVLYESPKRVCDTLEHMIKIYGPSRQVALCRELTKKFEQIFRGTLEDVLAQLKEVTTIKGECVLVLGPPVAKIISDAQIEDKIRELLGEHKVKAVAQIAADEFNIPRKQAYEIALKVKDNT
ncbi:16S rRNA (cytidine(1402)-2'-O)-methyltransferase [Amylibacter kogurei]|uniref:Ribosomal RNA small subunit methyltransferase I n=1 Tax=Paramylibacter kogurei TaxID=1889778 RepID=A0A2G5K3G9_9RHOB|nr:16S rRNA (cytidine(1402)-2'-O)-methyltransferase [Amylibacter kogurei]PIB23945.1 16S rRNA (cytidine(1402)-2'-O)-methyltransferase [Amylibacter kogurei]